MYIYGTLCTCFDMHRLCICNPSKCVKQSTLNINGYLPLGFGKTKGWRAPTPALDAEGRLSTVYKHTPGIDPSKKAFHKLQNRCLVDSSQMYNIN